MPQYYIQKTIDTINDIELEALFERLSNHIGDNNPSLPPFRLDKTYPEFSSNKEPSKQTMGSIQIFSLDLLMHFITMDLVTSVRVHLLATGINKDWYRYFATIEELKEQLTNSIALIELEELIPSRGWALGLYVP